MIVCLPYFYFLLLLQRTIELPSVCRMNNEKAMTGDGTCHNLSPLNSMSLERNFFFRNSTVIVLSTVIVQSFQKMMCVVVSMCKCVCVHHWPSSSVLLFIHATVCFIHSQSSRYTRCLCVMNVSCVCFIYFWVFFFFFFVNFKTTLLAPPAVVVVYVEKWVALEMHCYRGKFVAE